MRAIWSVTVRQLLRGKVSTGFSFLSVLLSAVLLSAVLLGGDSLVYTLNVKYYSMFALAALAAVKLLLCILLAGTALMIRGGFWLSLERRTRALGQLASVGADSGPAAGQCAAGGGLAWRGSHSAGDALCDAGAAGGLLGHEPDPGYPDHYCRAGHPAGCSRQTVWRQRRSGVRLRCCWQPGAQPGGRRVSRPYRPCGPSCRGCQTQGKVRSGQCGAPAGKAGQAAGPRPPSGNELGPCGSQWKMPC